MWTEFDLCISFKEVSEWMTEEELWKFVRFNVHKLYLFASLGELHGGDKQLVCCVNLVSDWIIDKCDWEPLSDFKSWLF